MTYILAAIISIGMFACSVAVFKDAAKTSDVSFKVPLFCLGALAAMMAGYIVGSVFL